MINSEIKKSFDLVKRDIHKLNSRIDIVGKWIKPREMSKKGDVPTHKDIALLKCDINHINARLSKQEIILKGKETKSKPDNRISELKSEIAGLKIEIKDSIKSGASLRKREDKLVNFLEESRDALKKDAKKINSILQGLTKRIYNLEQSIVTKSEINKLMENLEQEINLGVKK
jgi:predicted  nucleic acid-binding Zn-ribbon protein